MSVHVRLSDGYAFVISPEATAFLRELRPAGPGGNHMTHVTHHLTERQARGHPALRELTMTVRDPLASPGRFFAESPLPKGRLECC